MFSLSYFRFSKWVISGQKPKTKILALFFRVGFLLSLSIVRLEALFAQFRWGNPRTKSQNARAHFVFEPIAKVETAAGGYAFAMTHQTTHFEKSRRRRALIGIKTWTWEIGEIPFIGCFDMVIFKIQFFCNSTRLLTIFTPLRTYACIGIQA